MNTPTSPPGLKTGGKVGGTITVSATLILGIIYMLAQHDSAIGRNTADVAGSKAAIVRTDKNIVRICTALKLKCVE